MKPKNILITGSNGFVGRYLVEYYTNISFNVISLPQSIDIRDKDALVAFCLNNSFDYVIHLAAQTFVPESITNPQETYEINFFGTVNLLTSLLNSKFKGVFLFVGTSEEYGSVSSLDQPISEETILQPKSPYAVSKVAAELHCKSLAIRADDFSIIIARPFNHIGPGQNKNFVVSSFCRQVAMIKKDLIKPKIKVGNLKVARDFTDVRDVARAYHLLLEKGYNGESYNICSGSEVILEEILLELKEISGIDFEVEVSSELYRKVDQLKVLGSFDKINHDVGWSPEIPFDQSIYDTYEYWKTNIENSVI
jgi:GDP-4-dehydro-6-deoxy-D-mannose reductase